jgi:hypothetical protein
MLISRSASFRIGRVTQIRFTPAWYDWCDQERLLTIYGQNVVDFSSSCRHSYKVRVSVDELREILRVLAGAALAEPEKFEKEFGDSLRSLVQLQAIAAGVKI